MSGPLRLLVLALLALFAFAPPAIAEPMAVLAGTSLMEDLVKDVGGERVAVRSMIPAAACPGHYDLRASDAVYLKTAKVILLHDWQPRQGHVQALLASEPEARGKVRVIDVTGNWMLPKLQAEATVAVAAALAEADPAGADEFAARAKARIVRVAAMDEELRAVAARAGLPGTVAICDVMQRPFLEWLGFVVAADYGRFEETGPETLGRAMAAARAAGARLVVDNMQSTGAAGRGLAEDLGAAHVTLSNFPGGYPDAPTWEAAARKNVALLAAALRP